MKLDFTLAKKFSRNNIKGLELRTASLERAVVFNTSGKGYEKVRAALDAFMKEEEKEGRTPEVKLKGIGKSYEVSGKESFFDYVDAWYDAIIAEDGSIATYKKSNYSSDHICPGRTLFI